MTKREDWLIIGVSGVTCGGKTTIANKLKNILNPVYIFHQDKYFYTDDSPKHVKCKGIDHNNYDILSSLDMETMFNDVMETIQGENKAHSCNLDKSSAKLGIPGKKFIVMDGFTVLNYAPLNDICDLRYYLVLEYGECASRRALRLYDPPDVPGYFENCVWPEHLRYRELMEQDKRITFLDGGRPDNFDTILTDLKNKGAKTLSD